MPAPRFVLDEFWPSDLFLGGIPGAWYDPTDLSTMFQDSAGTTPVTAVEQPVGLVLDKSQGVTVGATIVTNGDFSGGTTGWTAGNGATLTSPASDLRIVGNGVTTYPYAAQALTSVAGRWYRATVTLKSANTNVLLVLRNGPYNAPTSQATNFIGTTPGTYSVWLYATGTVMAVGVEPSSGASTFDATIDDVSVVPVAGNHASQSTAASRPTYRARYNLLTQSEDWTQAVWSKNNITVTANSTTAPDGTTTADTLNEGTANNYHNVTQLTGATTSAGTYTVSVYAKDISARYVMVTLTQSAANYCSAVFDTAGGVVANSAASGVNFSIVSTSMVSAGNGWYRCTMTCTIGAGADFNIGLSDSATIGTFGLRSYTGTSRQMYVWGAQLLTAADVTATGNAYQRIAAATVYDTAAIFRPYLAFDGIDDSLATAAINFTSTDKMTVFAGQSKLQDATAACFCELSANVNTNAGSFTMFSPGNATGTLPGKYLVGLNASTALFADLSNYPAPDTSVLAVSLNNAGAAAAAQSIPRVDAATPTIAYNAANAGSGNFGNYAFFIGRRNNTSFPFNGRLYSLIVRGAASSVTEIFDAELWVNQRTGAF